MGQYMLRREETSHKLVIVRHGESEGNACNLFTGWQDSNLTEKGCEEAYNAGNLLMRHGFVFDICFTSNLKRAIDTAYLILGYLGLGNIQVINSYKLNIRHRGCLQGLNREEAISIYGNKSVFKWENDYYCAPPPADDNRTKEISSNPLYERVRSDELPLTESHFDVYRRTVEFYKNSIRSEISNNRKVLVVTHGETIAELLRFIIGDIPCCFYQQNIPNAIPIVVELDQRLNCTDAYYLLQHKGTVSVG